MRSRTASTIACLGAGLLLSITACSLEDVVGEVGSMGEEDYEGLIGDSGSDERSEGAREITAELHRIVDGDTVTVVPDEQLEATNDADDQHSVRVLGIDAPEMDWSDGDHECGAQQATDRLEGLLTPGDTVVLVFDEHAEHADRFGRSLAYLETESGVDLSQLLIEDGLVAAWYPTSEPEPERYSDYAQTQEEAQQQSTGSWEQCSEMGR